jgi:hypothetical protein
MGQGLPAIVSTLERSVTDMFVCGIDGNLCLSMGKDFNIADYSITYQIE